MDEPQTMSVEDWEAIFRTVPRDDLLRLKVIVDKLDRGGTITPEDRGHIIAMFGRPAEAADVA
ncbi:hypothetical protein [Prosthecomicrobium sp. N25]|uniref:hypothetical protein n=1 Tax=Prosthecomicrobium sp. N25 TaxID=3129254 RepID=UPI0030789670